MSSTYYVASNEIENELIAVRDNRHAAEKSAERYAKRHSVPTAVYECKPVTMYQQATARWRLDKKYRQEFCIEGVDPDDEETADEVMDATYEKVSQAIE